MEGGETQKGGDICIHIADSLCCTAETNRTLKQLYSNNKIKIKMLGLLNKIQNSHSDLISIKANTFCSIYMSKILYMTYLYKKLFIFLSEIHI